MLNKDFLRQILAEEKGLLALAEVAFISVPKYPELAIATLFAKFKADEKLMRYMPDKFPKGRVPDRSYFFNVLNTIYPDYTNEMVKVASNNRY